jgi:hypothetical protein
MRWSSGLRKRASGPNNSWDAGRPLRAKPSERRKPFQAAWVQFPATWLTALQRTKSASTWRLAVLVLFAEFRRQHTGGGIVLSAAMSGMPNTTRAAATKELVKLGLIEVEQCGRQAPRVVHINVG